ncbi:hypothetical protein PILCRDRAFT_488263 [Piloderma croceum F 1598]|uniref:Uncharacterized protein n=1 Tax=Piloderma croceum (strain F 1598) TaxID=765440 RepID=A0A0C3BWJ3_PILCF|nr:hypothetical protein PILCRDRAFT_488263 [Piloderma croceum F 1598]
MFECANKYAEKLHELDDSRCLVTKESNPSRSKSVILCAEEFMQSPNMNACGIWKKDHSTLNLVTLRAHCDAYNECFTIVLPIDVLERMRGINKGATLNKPYPGFTTCPVPPCPNITPTRNALSPTLYPS